MSSDIPNYDTWKLDSGLDDEIVYNLCDQCRENIYVGEEMLEIDGDYIHEDCFYEYAWKILSPNREVAEKVK